MNLLQRLNRRFGKLSIPHLMILISAGMGAVFLADLLFPQYAIMQQIDLNFAQVRSGQIWRLITFLIVPPSTSLIWIFFNLYFNCLIGEALEREWGSFCFTTFYLIGTVAAILAGLITGYGHNTYLNLSLFLAFAMFYPNFEVMIFFFIPVKVKYLALLDLVYFVVMLIFGSASVRVTILLSLVNLLIFFGSDLLGQIKNQAGYWKTRRNFRRNYRR